MTIKDGIRFAIGFTIVNISVKILIYVAALIIVAVMNGMDG